MDNNYPENAGLAALGLVQDAPGAPESLSELMETARLLRLPPDLLATQPEAARRQYLGRALARNPGLLRFAARDMLSRSLAVTYAREAGQAREAFLPLEALARDGLPEQANAGENADQFRSPGLDQTLASQIAPALAEHPAANMEIGTQEPAKDTGPDDDADNGPDDGLNDYDFLDGPDLYELSGGDIERAAELVQGRDLPRPDGEEEESVASRLLDPFKNFANGWLDLARGILGAGKSVPDLIGGRECALSKWFAASIESVKELEFATRRPESFGGRLAQDVVRNAPQLAAQIGAWIYTGAASSLGFIFSEIYGQDYLKHLDKGISPENAAFAGLLDASLQSAIEKMGLSALLRLPGLSSLTGELAGQGAAQSASILGEIGKRLGAGATGQIGLAAARGAAVEGVTEAAQHLPEYLADFWAESSLHNNSLADRLDWTGQRALDAANLLQGTRDALYEGLVGAILGAPVAGGHMAIARRRLRRDLGPEVDRLLEHEKNQARAVVRRLALEQALAKARESAAKIGDPAAARLLLEASLPKDMQKAFVSAEDLSSLLARKPERAQSLLEASGREIADINRALDSGLALEIDLASLLSANTEEARLMQESLRLDEDGPSLGQATAWSPERRLAEVMRVLNQEDELADFSEDERGQILAEEAQRAKHMTGRVTREVKRLARELRKAGLSDLEADTNAALLRAHALTWWKRYGVDGALLLERLSIENAEGQPEAPGRSLGGEEVEREERAEPSPEWMSGTPRPRKMVRRGQLALGQASAIIRLFRDRDVSTVAHESGHLFLQDLVHISQKGQSRVLEDFSRQMEAMLGNDIDFAAEIGEELARIREEAGSETHALREFSAQLARKARERAQWAEDMDGRPNGEKAGQDMPPESLPPESLPPDAETESLAANARVQAKAARLLARQARLAAGWIEAAQNARADLEIIARHAGLDDAALARAVEAALDLQITEPALLGDYTRLQEYAASAFSSWLGEGRSPSPKLAPVLGRFKQWLSSLWSRYRDSGHVSVSAELAGAFDRLLAPERELRLQDSMDALVHHEDAFINNRHVQGREAAALKSLLRRAQAGALNRGERLRRKKLEKMLREKTAQIYRELATDPFWLVAEKARFRFEDLQALLGAERAENLRQAWPRLVSQKGADPEQTAAEAGYESASVMLEELHERLAIRHESRRGQAEIMASDELTGKGAENGDPVWPLNPDFESYLAYMEDVVSSVAARMRLKNEAEIARWVDQSRVPQMLIDSMAATRINNTPLGQLTPANLERLLNRALSRRDRLLEAGKPSDLMEAMNQANEARVIYAMMSQAARAHKLLARIRSAGRKMADCAPGTYPPKHMEALRQLLSAYGLGFARAPVDYEHARALSDLVREIMQQEDCAGSMLAFPDWLLERRTPQVSDRSAKSVIPLGRLSPAQLEDLFNLMKFLDKSGRGERMARVESQQKSVESLAQNCAENMRELPDKPEYSQNSAREFFAKLADKGFAAVDILLWQMRKADGLKNIMGKGGQGPMEGLWGRIIKGEEGVRAWTDRVYRAMAPHLEQLEKCRQRLEREYGRNMRLLDSGGNELLAPASWVRAYKSKYYTAEMIFAMALHTGNSSNMERLLAGYNTENGLSPRTLYELFGDTRFAALKSRLDPHDRLPSRPGLLTAQDWRAVQGIWDALALLWPDIKRVHQSMYGFSPARIEPQPFEIRNPDGSISHLKGGYFPVRYDPRISKKVAAWTEQEELLASNQAMFIPPSVNKSYTRQRVNQAPGLPMLLNLSPIGEHVANAARFIELAQTVSLIDKVSQRPEFADAYKDKFGKEDYDAIRPNLRGLLRTEKVPDVIAWLEQRLRKYVVPWGLSWNPNVALIQSTAIFPAMGDLGHRQILSSLRQLILNPSLRKEIWKASPYMLSRMANLDQDLVRQLEFTVGSRPASISYKGKSYSWEDLVNLGMKGIIIVDAAATCTVWLAAYRAKINELSAKSDEAAPEQAPPSQKPAPESPLAPEQPGQNPAAQDPAAQESVSRARPANSERAGYANSADNASSEIRLEPSQDAASEDSSLARNPSPADEVILNQEDSLPPSRENASKDSLKEDQPGKKPAPVPDSSPARDSAGTGRKLIEFENAAHAQAVLYADTIVKQSNPDFDPSSRSSFLRSRGMMRLFNQFSSAITLFASRNHFMLTAYSKGRIEKARYLRHLADDFLFPAAALFLFFGAIRDFWDKEGKPATNFTGLLMDQLSMSIPIFGSLATDIGQNLMGMGSGNYRRGDLRTSLESPVDLAKNASASLHRLSSKNLTEAEKKAAIYALMDMASFVSRVPVSKVIRRADRGLDQYRRGEGTPFNIILPKAGK